MAAYMSGVFQPELQELIQNAKILLVGTGGIGCEVLKNLVLTGFQNIEVIDLDTIEVSNLNRQFLFHKQHVGKSKAQVAKESVLRFNPKAKIEAHQASIISNQYGVSFFKKFTLVLNALDNRPARNHVNRMCLAAEVPLLESGTSGYSGQVEVILKGKTKCYECDPKLPQKTYPGCTIRNTPSEPIHCIVWAKHLFNQLFGENDPDEDVSPDTADPEAAGDAGEMALNSLSNDRGNVDRVSTRAWAQSCDYDPVKLFTKFFHDDINYLLNMGNLWKTRRPPKPLVWTELPDAMEGSSTAQTSGMRYQRLWSIAECAEVFKKSVHNLKTQLKSLSEADQLTWDKDYADAMDFVTAVANIRAYIFGIPLKSRFDIKSMAGNIIPAIATSNAIVAGLVVMQTLNILKGEIGKCQTVYLRYRPNHKGSIIVPEKTLIKPNPKCRVCSDTPQVTLCTDTSVFTCKALEVDVLKNYLNMAAPDVTNTDGRVIISSEEGETEHNNQKTLKELGIIDGTILVADDFLQNYELKIIVCQMDFPQKDTGFVVVGDRSELKPKPEEKREKNGGEVQGNDAMEDDDDDDLIMSEPGEEEVPLKKRKIGGSPGSAKKRKTEEGPELVTL